MTHQAREDRASRPAPMRRAMEAPEMNMKPEDMPFDANRAISGGFETFVEA
ncbi:MAG TPA: hypothetical protein VFJ13_05930 [Paracoccaceae bacterium]|nr:hypothetical protein [Paracoccaceae bacterium]